MPRANAFTIGLTAIIQCAVIFGRKVVKVGRNSRNASRDYQGAWVFRTYAEAKAYLDAATTLRADNEPDAPERPVQDYSVYGLLLEHGWDRDVSAEPDPSDGVYRLLTDAEVLQVDPKDYKR